jgi:hypothetical protein
MVPVGWRAWYVGGAVYEGTTLQSWRQAPEDGLLVVMVYFDEFMGSERIRAIAQGDDCYWIQSDGSIAHNSDTPESNKQRYGRNIPLKRGMWTAVAEYEAAVAAAMASTWE